MFDIPVLDGTVPDDAGVAAPSAEAWSSYAPDGLLADMLSVTGGGSCWDRLERIGGWERVIAWAQAAQVREIAGFAAAAERDPEFGDDPALVEASVVAEVGLMTRLTPRTAAGRVADAVSLMGRLPETVRALSTGLISLAAARAIVEETGSLERQHLGEVQARVLAGAGGQTPSQIRAATRRAVARIDADAIRRRAEKAQRERQVRLVPEPDGMASLTAYLPAADAVAAYGVLDECARRAGGPGDTRGMDARRADALVDLILDRLATVAGPVVPTHMTPADDAPLDTTLDGTTPASGGEDVAAARRTRDRVDTQIRVTVPLSSLLGLDQQPGELAGYGPIPAHVARELAAEGIWRRLVTDPLSGALLDYGTTRYRPPPHLAEYVIVRDQTCDFPSCRTPAHRCDLDHRVPYDAATDSGPTSAENLGPRCRHHHQLKASPGWRLARESDGAIVWHTPTGHAYQQPPPPVAEPCGPPTPTVASHGDSPPF